MSVAGQESSEIRSDAARAPQDAHEFSFNLFLPTWARYVIALLAVGLASAGRSVFFHLVGHHSPYITFYPAITVAALFGGFVPGLLATALSAVAASIWMEQPGLSFMRSGEAIAMLVFIAGNLLIVGVCHAMRRARVKAADFAAAAEVSKASRDKDEFIDVLSHELRTPLTPVLLATALLESRTDLPADAHKAIQMIRRHVELETRVIDDLLDITRLTKGKLHLDSEPVDLHLLIRSAADICSQGSGANITLDLRAESHIVQGDSARLQQVFWHLLTNARKFTPADGVIVVRSASSGPARIIVEVLDNGFGIEPDCLSRIFSAFERGQAGRMRKFGGMGLGLAISHAIVTGHGGSISAASPGRGKGATFSVQLPTTPAMTTLPDPFPPVDNKICRSLKVLLVEDHTPTRKLMTDLLQGFGHAVRTADSVESALGLALHQPFDLLISDLGLPDGTGHDLMRHLNQHRPIAAIALSGYGLDEDILASKEAGFIEHLVKPIDIDKLQAVIHRVSRLIPSATALPEAHPHAQNIAPDAPADDPSRTQ